MACLYMPTAFLLSDLEIWVRPTAKREKDQAISILKSLHIVSISIPTKEAPQTLTLTPNFRSSLRLALEGGGKHNSFGVPSTQPIPSDTDATFLDRYAHKKWDDILHFVVNSVGLGGGGGHSSSSGPKQSVKDLLVGGRLVERRNVGSGIIITQAGFTFLLQETNAQVWTLLLLWLEAADHAANGGDTGVAVDSVDMLSFFFLLASLEHGRAYSTDALTEKRQNMLPNLVDFGLIYIPPSNPHQFFPTRLATTLTSSETALRSVSTGFSAATTTTAGAGSTPVPTSAAARAEAVAVGESSSGGGGGGGGGGLGDAQDRNSIILETNFRMYAYVQSPLQIAVLALFSELKFRFKGLVSGHLTRASIRRAIDMGITSDQIISYLATHAHEQMRRVAAATKKPILPPVVVDQIRLWQLDSERMAATNGWLFKNYDSHQEYMDMANFADDIGVVVWRNDRRRMFFANRIDQIKDYMKVRGKAREQQQK